MEKNKEKYIEKQEKKFKYLNIYTTSVCSYSHLLKFSFQ